MPQGLFDIAAPPPVGRPHLYADYIELLCVVTADHIVCTSDLTGTLREDAELHSELSADLYLDASFDPSTGEYATGPPTHLGHDAREECVGRALNQIAYRGRALGDGYPFALRDGGRAVELAPATEDAADDTADRDQRRRYLFCLLAASHQRMNAVRRIDIPNAFELVAAHAIRELLPGNADTHLFSRNRLDTTTRYYSGSKAGKIRALARDMHETPSERTLSQLSPHDAGDEGLDIVAWLPLGDNARGLLTVFAQCTVSSDWTTKAHEPDLNVWRRYVNFHVDPTKVMVIPYCFRDDAGKWPQEAPVGGSILLDRLRLLSLLKSNTGRLNGLPYDLVDEALSSGLSLFDMAG